MICARLYFRTYACGPLRSVCTCVTVGRECLPVERIVDFGWMPRFCFFFFFLYVYWFMSARLRIVLIILRWWRIQRKPIKGNQNSFVECYKVTELRSCARPRWCIPHKLSWAVIFFLAFVNWSEALAKDLDYNYPTVPLSVIRWILLQEAVNLGVGPWTYVYVGTWLGLWLDHHPTTPKHTLTYTYIHTPTQPPPHTHTHTDTHTHLYIIIHN